MDPFTNFIIIIHILIRLVFKPINLAHIILLAQYAFADSGELHELKRVIKIFLIITYVLIGMVSVIVRYKKTDELPCWNARYFTIWLGFVICSSIYVFGNIDNRSEFKRATKAFVIMMMVIEGVDLLLVGYLLCLCLICCFLALIILIPFLILAIFCPILFCLDCFLWFCSYCYRLVTRCIGCFDTSAKIIPFDDQGNPIRGNEVLPIGHPDRTLVKAIHRTITIAQDYSQKIEEKISRVRSTIVNTSSKMITRGNSPWIAPSFITELLKESE